MVILTSLGRDTSLFKLALAKFWPGLFLKEPEQFQSHFVNLLFIVKLKMKSFCILMLNVSSPLSFGLLIKTPPLHTLLILSHFLGLFETELSK